MSPKAAAKAEAEAKKAEADANKAAEEHPTVPPTDAEQAAEHTGPEPMEDLECQLQALFDTQDPTPPHPTPPPSHLNL